MLERFDPSLDPWLRIDEVLSRPSPSRPTDKKTYIRFNTKAARLPDPEPIDNLEIRKQKYETLIRIAHGELSKWNSHIPVPHLFLLADIEGVLLETYCPSELQDTLQKIGLIEGVHLGMNRLGINGVSLAMEQQTIVAVRGEDHDMALFWPFNCLCIPIRAKNCTAGYLDLTFSRRYEIEFAIPILLQIVDKIELRLNGDPSDEGKERLFKLFCQYNLTPREQEAAYGWLRNHSVMRIAGEMNISEGTVRNMIKKVYAKTKTSDKGQFIKTFLGAL